MPTESSVVNDYKFDNREEGAVSTTYQLKRKLKKRQYLLRRKEELGTIMTTAINKPYDDDKAITRHVLNTNLRKAMEMKMDSLDDIDFSDIV